MYKYTPVGYLVNKSTKKEKSAVDKKKEEKEQKKKECERKEGQWDTEKFLGAIMKYAFYTLIWSLAGISFVYFMNGPLSTIFPSDFQALPYVNKPIDTSMYTPEQMSWHNDLYSKKNLLSFSEYGFPYKLGEKDENCGASAWFRSSMAFTYGWSRWVISKIFEAFGIVGSNVPDDMPAEVQNVLKNALPFFTSIWMVLIPFMLFLVFLWSIFSTLAGQFLMIDGISQPGDIIYGIIFFIILVDIIIAFGNSFVQGFMFIGTAFFYPLIAGDFKRFKKYLYETKTLIMGLFGLYVVYAAYKHLDNLTTIVMFITLLGLIGWQMGGGAVKKLASDTRDSMSKK